MPLWRWKFSRIAIKVRPIARPDPLSVCTDRIPERDSDIGPDADLETETDRGPDADPETETDRGPDADAESENEGAGR